MKAAPASGCTDSLLEVSSLVAAGDFYFLLYPTVLFAKFNLQSRLVILSTALGVKPDRSTSEAGIHRRIERKSDFISVDNQQSK